jgi:hypothetical protein
MCEHILLGILIAVSVCDLKAQQDTGASSHLSAAFAQRALVANKAILQCTDTMFLEDGRVAVPADTQGLIDGAEDAAKADAERALVTVLKDLFLAKLNTNMSRAMILLTGSPFESNALGTPRQDVYETIKAAEEKQRHCRVALGIALHSRKYTGTLSECRDVAR